MLSSLRESRRIFKPAALFERMRKAFSWSRPSLPVKKAQGRGRRRDVGRVLFEPVEQRLLLSADISVGMAAGADDLTVRLEDVDGVAMIRVLNNADGSVVAQSAAGDVSAVRIHGSSGADRLRVDLTRDLGVSVDFSDSGSGDGDRLEIIAPATTWTLSGLDRGVATGAGLVTFSGVENLLGSVGNIDTFVLQATGGSSGLLDGGAGGYDSLVIEARPVGSTTYAATGPDSGLVTMDGSTIRFAGLEPVDTDASQTNFVFDGTAAADHIVVRKVGLSKIRIESANNTFESYQFNIPSTSLTIKGGLGDDVIELIDFEFGSLPSFDVDGEAGTNTIVVSAPKVIDLEDSQISLTTNNVGPTIGLSSIQQAWVNGLQVDTSQFTGHVVASTIAQWTEQGPGPVHGGLVTGIADKPVSGAIQSVLAHPSDANTIYIGSVNGGVWKTTDGGTSWTPLTDALPSQSISALAFDTADATRKTIYAGTGKLSNYYDFGKALGLYKSTDGGATWTAIRASEFADNTVYSIVANGPVVLVATEHGLYRSENGGASFSLVLRSAVTAATVQNGGSGYIAGEIVSATQGTVPAQFRVKTVDAAGAVIDVEFWNRGSYTQADITAVGGTLATTGGGNGALTLAPTFTATGVLASANFLVSPDPARPINRVSEVVADPNNANRIYVSVADQGVFRSLDGGLTFVSMDTTLPAGFSFAKSVRIRLSVSPAADGNPDTKVFVGVVTEARPALTVAAAKDATELTVASVVGLEVGDDVTIVGDVSGVANQTVKITALDRAANKITVDKGLSAARSIGDTVFTGKPRANAILRLQDDGSANGSTVTWTRMDMPGDQFGGINRGGQGFKNFSMVADNVDPDVVYVGGDTQSKDANGNPVGSNEPQNWTGRLMRGDLGLAAGSQWTPITDKFANLTAPHADSRNMVIDANGNILEVDDGGIKKLVDIDDSDGNREWFSVDGNLRLAEFHSVAYDPNNNIIIGGSQDNGVSRQNAQNSKVWTHLIQGDGAIVNVAVDGSTSYLYGSAQNLGPFLAFTGLNPTGDLRDLEVNGSGTWYDDNELTSFDSTVPFYTKWVVNSTDPDRLMFGTHFLYEDDPDFPFGIFTDPGDDVSLLNGSPVPVDGKLAPDPNARVGIVLSVAYGGKQRVGGTLETRTHVAYASVEDVAPDRDGRLVGTGKGSIFVRTGEGQRFLKINSWNTGAPAGAIANDIVMDPEDWRTLYVIDSNGKVWVGKQDAVDATKYAWAEVTGNLDKLAVLAGNRTELYTLDIYHDEGPLANSDADDTRVVMVGTYGGVFRATNPTAASAAWSELGSGMPSVLVTDLHYNAQDDILLAGTLGRGAFTISNASLWLKTPSLVTVRGATGASDDTFRLVVNEERPWLMDVFVHDSALAEPAVPLASISIQTIDSVKVFAGGGNDTIKVDSRHGLLTMPGGIEIDGGTGSNTLELEWPSLTGTTPGPTTITADGPDGFGEASSSRITFTNVTAPGTASIDDPVDATGGGMEALASVWRSLLEDSLSGQDIPFFNAPSLSNGLSGRMVDIPDPVGLGASKTPSHPAGPRRDALQVRPGAAAQVDVGQSLLDRLFQSSLGTFNLSEIARSVTSLQDLAARMDALDDVDGNVTLDTSTPGVTLLNINLVRMLSGIVDLDLDGQALLDTLLPDGTIRLDGLAEIEFEAALALTIGIDASGFFVKPNASGPELKLSKIKIGASGVEGSGKFGFLGVHIENATVTFDEDVAINFKLSEPGVVDGKIRLGEFAGAANLLTMSVDEDATDTDLVVVATLGVAAIIPGFDITLPISDIQATFTWEDLSDDVQVQLGGDDTDFLRFLKLDPATLIGQLSSLKTSLADMVADVEIDIPFVSVGLSGLVDVFDTFDANLLSRLGYQIGGGGPTLPTFGTVQGFTSGLVSSLFANATPAHFAGLVPYDISDLPDFLEYDADAGELLLHLKFFEDFELTQALDLGFDIGGIGELSTNANVTFTGTFGVETTIGIDLDLVFDGANPQDWLFLRDTSLSFNAHAEALDFDALARFGFVKIEIFDGEVIADLGVSLALTDPKSTADDQRIDLREIIAAVTGDVGSLFDLDFDGSASMELPVKVPFLGINGTTKTPDNTLVVSIPDLANLSNIQVQPPGALSDLGNFLNIDAAGMVGMLGQLTFWLDQFRQSDAFADFDIPVAGSALSSILGFADSLRDKLLVDDIDNGADDNRTLLFDINAAIEAAGLGDRLYVENAGGGKLRLAALDPAITSFTVQSSSAIFGAGQVSSKPAGAYYATLLSGGVVGNALGTLGGDLTLTISIDGAAAVEVKVLASDTAANTRIGDDVWKLIKGDNAPTFTNVEDMAVRLLDVFGANHPGIAYHAGTQTLTFTLDIGEIFGQLNLPLNLALDELPEFIKLHTNGLVTLKAEGDLNLEVGVFLGPAEPTDKLSLSKPLSQLAQPVVIATEQRITAPAPVRTVVGQLSADATFQLKLDAEDFVTVKVTKAAASDNQTVDDLLADITAALQAAGLGLRVAAQRMPNADSTVHRLQLVVTDAAVTQFEIVAATTDAAVKDLGLPAGKVATGASAVIQGTKNLPELRGRLTADATFAVALNNVNGGTPFVVTLTPDDTATNRYAFDIVNDILGKLPTFQSQPQWYYDTGATDPETGAAIMAPRLDISISDGRLVFTGKGGAASLSITAIGGTAATELGLGATNLSGNSHDLKFILSDGSVHFVTLDGVQTIGDVVNRIHAQTSNEVEVTINEKGSGLNLRDTTFTAASTTVFKVQLANNSPAGLTLGIVRADDGDGEAADGKIQGSDIAALTPLDRFFIKATPEGDDPLAGLTLEVATPTPVSATAEFGFVGLTLAGTGALPGPGNKALTAALNVRLIEPSGSTDGRISLAELLNSLDDIGSLFDLSLTGAGKVDLVVDKAKLPDFIQLNGTPRISAGVTFGNVLAGADPVYTFEYPDFGDLLSFGNTEFNWQSILAGLKALIDFLDDFEALGFLSEPIPVIDVSVKDLVSIADQFADAVEQAQQNPAGTLQLLEDKLLAAMGRAPGDPLLDISLVDVGGKDVVKFMLNLQAAFDKKLGLNIDLAEGLGVDDLPFDLGGSADLRAQGSVQLDLDFGFQADDPLNIFVFDTTGFAATLNLAATQLTFKAAAGPFGVFVDQGTAILKGNVPNAPANTAVRAGFANPTGQALALETLDLGDLAASVRVDVDVDLPVYFPADTVFAGTVKLDGFVQYANGALSASLTPSALNAQNQPVALSQLFTFDPGNLSLLDKLVLGVDGIDFFLEGLQDLLDGGIGGFSLPLIGDKLSGAAASIGDFRNGFVEKFRKTLEDLANPSAAFAAAGYSPSPGAVTQLVAPAERDPISKLLFDLLKSNGGLGLVDSIDDIEFITNVNQPGLDPEDVDFAWKIHMNGQLLNAGAGIGFDLGIPGLGLETEGAVNLTIDWALDLGFGINLDDGFYLDVGDQSELELNARLTLPGIGITGKLGFLQVKAEENENPDSANSDDLTSLTANFAVDIRNRQDLSDDKLGFAELGKIGVDLKIAAEAIADLTMRLALNSDLVPGAPTNFPSIVADFRLDWGLGSVGDPLVSGDETFVSMLDLDGSFLENGLRYVAFSHVGLDLGSYFSDLIFPIVEKVQEITEPIKPFLDFLTEPIPVISDLAGPTSLLDIAAMSGLVNPGIIKAIEVVDQVIDIAHMVKGQGGNVVMYFDAYLPSMVLVDNTGFNALATGSIDLSNPNLNLKDLKDQLLANLDFLPEELQDAVGAVGGFLEDGLSKMLPGGGVDEGFKLPIIEDPSQIFGMLLGQPADLVTFSMAPLMLEAEFSAFFSILGPLGVSINAEFAAQFGPFKFGYDTTGITSFASSDFKNPLLLFDGLYVSDLDAEGVDVPELQFDAALWAAAELNLAIARGGVGGGLFAEIDMDLHDPDGDGRVRIKELVANVVNQYRYFEKALAPLAMFDITGKLTAELFAFVKVDIPFFPIDEKIQITDPITLLDFESNFTRVPTLATELGGGVLQLNMGKFAEQRVEGDLTDGNEHFIVKQVAGSTTDVWVWSTLVDFDDDGYDQEEAQRYTATATIIALGGEGDDTIDLSGVTSSVKYEIEGGAGNDKVWAGTTGTGKARILGGAGDDELHGGGGNDDVFGEVGDDKLWGGGGHDWLFGDGKAKDIIQGDVIVVDAKPSDGKDTLEGDDGDDLLIGGGNEDTLEGGANADVLIGDGAKVFVDPVTRLVKTKLRVEKADGFDDATRYELAVYDTSKNGRGAKDTIKGEGGNDRIWGGAGDDDLWGGDEDDVLFGEIGQDTVRGEGGNDIAFGDSGTFVKVFISGSLVLDPTELPGGERDTLFGGAGNDKLLGGAGNDEIEGNEGDDMLKGGVGFDELRGDAGNDRVFGGADADTLHGGEGDDYLEGGGGNDLQFGGNGNDTLVAGYGSDTLDGQEGGDLYRITARGGPVTELTTAYDSGSTGNDTLYFVGTAFDDTVLLRAMADSYFPLLDKLNGLIDRYMNSTVADRLAAILQSFEDAYGPHDIGYGMVQKLVERYQANLLPGLLNAIDTTYEAAEPGKQVPTKEALKALIEEVFESDTQTKLDAMEKAITGAYNAVAAKVPATMFNALRAAWQTSASIGQLQVAIADYYVRESLYPTQAGLRLLVEDIVNDPDIDDEDELEEILAAVEKAYGSFGSQADAVLAALEAEYDPDAANLVQKLHNAINGAYVGDPVAESSFTDTAFIALINNGGLNVERFNYRRMEGIVVNTIDGNDYVALDDLKAAATINLGLGDDQVQVGQVFKSERVKDFDDEDFTGIDPGDEFTTIEITRGWLSNGVSVPTTIFGNDGDDRFTVFRNVAVLNLNGGNGDDVFTVRAFALRGSTDNERARTDMKGDGGADTILYVVNAPVGIDGGDGFDTVRIVGTEFGDDFVITDSGVYGAGLNVTYVNIEKLVADGAEGDDRFFVLSTGLEVVTEIDGGLGSDTFFVGGNPSNAPISVVSNDLRGHSGVMLHSVTSATNGWNALPVEGVSANVGDNEEANILVMESGGSSTVFEGGTGGLGWEYDTYRLFLTRAPSAGASVVIAIVPAGRSPEDDAMGFEDMDFSLDGGITWTKDAANLKVTLDGTTWATGKEVRFRATQDAVAEGRRITFINHVIDQTTSDFDFAEAQVRSIKVFMEDDDQDGVVIRPSGGSNRVLEGGFTDTFDVILTKPSTQTVTVQMQVLNNQISLSSMTLVFAPGETSKSVIVTANDDTTVEGFHTDFISYTVTSADKDVTVTPQSGDTIVVSGDDIVVQAGGWFMVDGDLDAPGAQTVPGDKATYYVLLPHRPVGATVDVRVNGNDTVNFTVSGNTLSFKTADGAPMLVTGLVEVKYSYVEKGYDGLDVRDSVVDILDNDTPTVIVETIDDGMVDVIEGGVSDSYRIRLASDPGEGAVVTVKVTSEQTRTTWGGSALFNRQLDVDNPLDFFIAGEEAVFTFTGGAGGNWATYQTVVVSAIDDDEIDGNDTQVFAPDLQTVNKIRGPLVIEGAAGAGSLSLPKPLMMPWEKNQRESDGAVLDFEAAVEAADPEYVWVRRVDLLEVVEDLKLDDPFITIARLVGKTFEVTRGPGLAQQIDPERPDDLYDRFWLITAVDEAQPDGMVKLTLQNPSQVDATQLDALTTDSEWAITALSINFFADERDQIDYMFVYDNHSVADDFGALTSADGAVLHYDAATNTMRVETRALQAVADLLGLDIDELIGRALEITTGLGNPTVAGTNGLGRVWTIQDIDNYIDETTGIKVLTLANVSGSGAPNERSEFRIQGSDRYGRLVGLGMGPNVFFGGQLQGGGITYGDIEVTEVHLGRGNDTMRVDYATNSEDHATERSGDFNTQTILHTGGGNDIVNVRLAPGEDDPANAAILGRDGDGAFSVDLGDGNDKLFGADSTRGIVAFGGRGNDEIHTGSGDDIVFGDIGRVDYIRTTLIDGEPVDEIITRLGHSVLQNPKNPHVTGATLNSITDDTRDFRDPYGSLIGLGLQAISAEGRVQHRVIVGVSDDGHTLFVDREWDQLPVFDAPDEDDDSYYRISAYPEDQTDGTFRGARLAWSILESEGGTDTLHGGSGRDLLVGGAGADTMHGEGDADWLIGDNARVDHVPLAGLDGPTRAIRIESLHAAIGGDDTLYGEAGDDIVIGGAGADALDGGLDRDLIFGDNVVLDLLAVGSGDAIEPRFVTLAGTSLYDANGNPAVGGPGDVPGGAPTWADWRIALDQDITDTARWGDDRIAGGAGDDQIFGQRGNDKIQGDGSIALMVAAARNGSTGLLEITASQENTVTDGDDYIEGNAGDDVIFGNLGQDDLIGGSSTLFSLGDPGARERREDGADFIFGGAGLQTARNHAGAGSHGRDADTIVGDNGNIYRAVGVQGYLGFNYDDGYDIQLVPRAVQLVDYTLGGPDKVPGSSDLGAGDELHGEGGDDAIYGMTGNDVVFGEGEDDVIIGGWGDDWISGGTGDDGILGDDGRLFVSRNTTVGEPLNGVAGIPANQMNLVVEAMNGIQFGVVNVLNQLKYTADLALDNLDPSGANNTLHRPVLADDIIYGGLGTDSIHGGAGDDAISGAEALTLSYTNNYDINGAKLNAAAIRSDYERPFNPGNVLGYQTTGTNATKFALFDAANGLRTVKLNLATGALVATGGVDWLLNFVSTEGPIDTFWIQGQNRYSGVRTDGDDHVFGDLGNDWLVGGTGRDSLWAGRGDDLMNGDDLLSNTVTTDTNPSYEDLMYGGAGRDVMLINTNGDRAIDWAGEFNSYYTPFSQFGMASVLRLIQPGVPEYLMALSKSQGADQTLSAIYNSSPARNGEPFGEIGLVLQSDADWAAQNGPPRDAQAGNSKGKVDVTRSAGVKPIYQVAADVAPSESTELLTPADLSAVVEQARRLWRAVLGASDSRLALLDGVQVQVGNLPDGRLGVTMAGAILIDANAAGFGWFIDTTPDDAAEFERVGGQLLARAGSAAAGRMDLLSVVVHELGHALGLDHGHGVMETQLQAGQRLLPEGFPQSGRADPPPAQAFPAPAWAADSLPPTAVPIDWTVRAPLPAAGPKPAGKASPTAVDRTADWQLRFVNHLGAGAEKVDPYLRMRVHLPITHRMAAV